MAVLHRALFTWFICLMFLILVVLRLDQRVRYVPTFLLHVVMIEIIVQLLTRKRKKYCLHQGQDILASST